MMMRMIALYAAAFALVTGMPAQSQSFTLQKALSAPFASDLVASPQLGRFAWTENQQGKRNLWLAKPDGSGKYVSKQLTSYDQDDGQEVYQIAWTPDAEHLIYVRGGDSEFLGRPDPNPALAPEGVAQNIWLIAATGGEPRKLGEGYGPVVSPAGDQVAFLSHGQIWAADLSLRREALHQGNSGLRWISKAALAKHRHRHGDRRRRDLSVRRVRRLCLRSWCRFRW
jgi:hypothetical protein